MKNALPLLCLLCACNGLRGLTRDRDTDGDTDAAADTDTGEIPRDWDALVDMFVAVNAPAEWYYQVHDWRDDPPVCPTIQKTGDVTWTLTGGCTAADGTAYEGKIEHLDADYGERILFVGFRVTSADSDLTYDGEIVLPNDPDQLQSEYAARDAADVVVYAYDNHTLTPFSSWKTVYRQHESGSYAYGGRFTAAGSGAFTITGTAEHAGKCDQEPDQGTLTFAGPKQVEFTFNGAAICDGCVPFEDEYGPGDICPWRE